MGLKSFFSRWSKGEDERAIERAEEDSRGTALQRDLDQEDFEGKKEDLLVEQQDFASSEAFGAAEDELRD
jgi:fumarylacetoacetate (FAA) hydrolase family protein